MLYQIESKVARTRQDQTPVVIVIARLAEEIPGFEDAVYREICSPGQGLDAHSEGYQFQLTIAAN